MALQNSVGSIQASSGSLTRETHSQTAAEIAHSAATSEGKQESLPQLSPPLQGTEFVLGILQQSCLHLKGGPVTSNAFSEGFALACCSGESQQLQVVFIPQLQTCGALALRDVHTYHMDMGRSCSPNHTSLSGRFCYAVTYCQVRCLCLGQGVA